MLQRQLRIKLLKISMVRFACGHKFPVLFGRKVIARSNSKTIVRVLFIFGIIVL